MLPASERSPEPGSAVVNPDLAGEALTRLGILISGDGVLRCNQFEDHPALEWVGNDQSSTWDSRSRAGAVEPVGRLSGPVQFFLRLIECWHLKDDPRRVQLLGYDTENLEDFHALTEGRHRLSGRDLEDRIAHLFEIRRILSSLFRDIDVENEWLRESNSLLDSKTPLSLMLEGSMENLLLVREYIESAAGIR